MSDETPKFDPSAVPTGDGVLRREHFSAEGMRFYAEMAKRDGMGVLDEDVRNALFRETMAQVMPGSDVWVFGYGSLMWNPIICVAESRVARVEGFYRHFCLCQTLGRGSPEKPGLMLALDEGGSCTGVAHRVAASDVESEIGLLWQREMLSGAYRPHWIDAHAGGETLSALTFVVDRTHKRYEGLLPFETIARRIAAAQGVLGTNRDYLYRMAKHLSELGVADDDIARLEREVRALAREPHTEP